MNTYQMLLAEKTYHQERLAESERCRLVRLARGSRTGAAEKLAVWLGDRLIKLGEALKESAARQRAGEPC